MRLPVDFNLFEATSYRSVVEASLLGDEGHRQHGSVKALAKSLKCHSTFVAHVRVGKADFSAEQALRFCRHIGVNDEATAFFLDLVSAERAADLDSKAYFEARLERARAERRDLKKRLKIAGNLTPNDEARYCRSWVTQAVHMHCQLPGLQTAATIAASLGVEQPAVEDSASILVDLGFIRVERGEYICVNAFFHLGKDSPFTDQIHINWRLKAVQNLGLSGTARGFHYSSVVSLSEETAAEVTELIMKHIESSRKLIAPSPSKLVYSYSLDFFPLSRKRE